MVTFDAVAAPSSNPFFARSAAADTASPAASPAREAYRAELQPRWPGRHRNSSCGQTGQTRHTCRSIRFAYDTLAFSNSFASSRICSSAAISSFVPHKCSGRSYARKSDSEQGSFFRYPSRGDIFAARIIETTRFAPRSENALSITALAASVANPWFQNPRFT